MKHCFLRFIPVFIAALIFVGCQKDTKTLRLNFEKWEQGKMYFNERTFAWQDGDIIVVNGAPVEVTNSRANVPIANIYYAMYPQQYVESMNGNSIALNIPRIQEYKVQDGHQVIHSPIFAVADGDASSLSFKNLGSLLAITIANDGDAAAEFVVDSVTLASVDATIALWGEATISNPDSDHPQYEFSSAAASHGSTMLAKVNDGVVESMNITLGAQCSTTVYMFIPAVPNNVNNRFSITICGHTATTINKYTMTQSNNAGGNIARNTLTAIPFRCSIATSDIRNISSTPEGALTGIFSVSSTQRVYFSKGNLQCTKTLENGNNVFLWKFAEAQTTSLLGQNQTVLGSTESSISETIDLFYWGSSGKNISEDPFLLTGPQGGSNGSELWHLTTIAGTDYDWGKNNPISNGGNQANLWRTMTASEWSYLLDTRTVNGGARAGYSYQYVKINDIAGLLIFHDAFTGQSNYPVGSNLSAIPEGCAFLPVTGYINLSQSNNQVGNSNLGYYWTADPGYIKFKPTSTRTKSYEQATLINSLVRCAVRLVQNVPSDN